MAIIIPPGIETKLDEKHSVCRREVEQCFENLSGALLKDTRDKHQSDPPTLWFIAPTNKNRLLKVCFVPRDGDQYLRTCYAPSDEELRIYRKYGQPRDF